MSVGFDVRSLAAAPGNEGELSDFVSCLIS